MHILLFPQRPFPCDHAMLESVYTRLLPRRGHQITWIMRRGGPEHSASPVAWNESRAYLIPAEPNGHRFRTLGVGSRIARSIQLAEAVNRAHRVDLIQVRNELSSGWVARYLRRKWRVPFVFQLSFPVLDAETGGRGMRDPRGAGRPMLAMKRRAQLDLVRKADRVLAISDEMKTRLVETGVPESRVLTIPMGVDTSMQPEAYDPSIVRDLLGLGEAPAVLYFGALDRIRRLEFLLEVMRSVRTSVRDARLILLGSASNDGDVEWLRNEIGARRLEGAVILAGRVPRSRVPLYLTASSLSVSPIPPIPLYLASSPTKVLESLGMGVPVVANDEIPEQRR